MTGSLSGLSFFLAATALAGLFVVVNIAARYDYALEGDFLVARWRILWVVPFRRKRIALTSIAAIDGFDWRRDLLRYFRPFGRPFSSNGAMIRFNGIRSPIYVTPEDPERFRRNVLYARDSVLGRVAPDLEETGPS